MILPKKVGLFFGTFDPIHNAHIHAANQMIKYTDIEKVLFLVTPQSPYKLDKKISSYYDRYNMVEIALSKHENLLPCDYEKDNTPPYYSINTLNRLSNDYPDVEFVYIMGSDNAVKLDKWIGIDEIMDNYSFYVFKREPYSDEEVLSVINSLKNGHKNKLISTEPYDMSSTQIRLTKKVRDNHVPEGVSDYFNKHHLY